MSSGTPPSEKRTSSSSSAAIPLSVRDAHPWLEGQRAFAEGKYELAQRRFAALLVMEPRSPALLAACGHAWLHAGDQERALDHYRRAEEAAGGPLPEILWNRAQLLQREEAWPQVLDLLRQLASAPPPVEQGVFYLGLFYANQEEFLAEIGLRLGEGCKVLGLHSEAQEWLRHVLQWQPENLTARQRLAELAILTKNYTTAIEQLELVLENASLDEDRIHAHNNLGIACYENGQLDDAINHLTWVLRRSPADPTAIHNLNFIYEREGILDREDRTSHAIRFMDVKEGASPIFGLLAEGAEDKGELQMIGRSAEMLRVMRHARLAAASDNPVLIQGEPGTGKEMLARLIARNSDRSNGPFLVVHCSSLSELMLQSELFGHEKGAFTGARSPRQGALEAGEHGVVFLDEVDALTPMLQGRLLRAVMDGKFTPMAASRPHQLRGRLIAATSKDLRALVEEGKFREDLFYALNIVPIDVPPLRDRREDIPLLVDHFLRKFGRHSEHREPPNMTPDDVHILMDHDWPGNVRELENLIARAVVMGTQSNLYLEELARLRRQRAEAKRKKGPPEEATYGLDLPLQEVERRHIMSVLERAGNNQRQAAKILGINPTTLWRKLKGYEESEAAARHSEGRKKGKN